MTRLLLLLVITGFFLFAQLGVNPQSQGGVLSASHYRDEMAVIHALGELVNPSHQSSPQQIVSMQEHQVSCAVDHHHDGPERTFEKKHLYF